ncbi:MAG TPA: serine/threonine-protein kinase [Kofleriaceae bacterium]|jgi:serine/threonine-protein kinase
MSLVGQVLGSYRITEELSTGGMGTVYRAQHELLARPAAVKVLRADLTTRSDAIGRFFTEARAVSAIRHPGIVEVFDFGYTDDGSAFLAMELLVGESLKARIARGRLTESQARAIGGGIASALAAAHAKGIYHRDLKPDNIFVLAGDRPKLLDFGVAKLTDRQDGFAQTVDGALLGTPSYMAPEQARAASSIDHRADLYSLGCILYEMAVGAPPFTGVAAGELIAKHLFEVAEPPRARGAAISPAFEAVITKLLQKLPDDRYASANDVVRVLTGTPSRRWVVPALAITIALAAAGVGGFVLTRPKPAPSSPPPIVDMHATPPPVTIAAPVTPQPPPAPVVKPHPKPHVVSKKLPACDGETGEHDSHCAPIESTP